MMSVSSVTAIGVSPPKLIEDFSPNEKFTFTYNIINKGHDSHANVRLYGSPLVDYIEASSLDFPLPNGVTPLELTMKLPSYNELPNAYGKQDIKIFIAEVAAGGSGFSAVTAVEARLIINVPVPGEYGVITAFDIPTVVEGFDTQAVISIKNRGTQPLHSKTARINITDAQGESIASILFPPINLAVGEEQEFRKIIPSSKYDSAKYLADASFYFDADKLPATKKTSFFIGSTDVGLGKYTTVLKEGEINKVSVNLQSLWGDSLRGVRGAIVDFDGNSQALPVIDLAPFELSNVQTFIDVPFLNESPFLLNSSFKNATFDTVLTLEFPVGETADAVKEIPLTFTVVAPTPEVIIEEKTPISSMQIMVISLAAFTTLLVAVLLFIIFKKSGSDKHEKKKSKK